MRKIQKERRLYETLETPPVRPAGPALARAGLDTGFSTGMTAKPSPSGTVRHHGWRPKKAASAWQCRAGRSFFMAR